MAIVTSISTPRAMLRTPKQAPVRWKPIRGEVL
jgi:hypothetical protein